jgi:hypothetical protein
MQGCKSDYPLQTLDTFPTKIFAVIIPDTAEQFQRFLFIRSDNSQQIDFFEDKDNMNIIVIVITHSHNYRHLSIYIIKSMNIVAELPGFRRQFGAHFFRILLTAARQNTGYDVEDDQNKNEE